MPDRYTVLKHNIRVIGLFTWNREVQGRRLCRCRLDSNQWKSSHQRSPTQNRIRAGQLDSSLFRWHPVNNSTDFFLAHCKTQHIRRSWQQKKKHYSLSPTGSSRATAGPGKTLSRGPITPTPILCVLRLTRREGGNVGRSVHSPSD